MSESPLMDTKHSPTLHHPSSPPANSNSNSQLAAILADSYRENEQLKRDVVAYRRRAEKAEKLVQTFQKIAEASSSPSQSSQPQPQSSQSQVNGSPNGHLAHALQDLPEAMVRIVLDLEERTQRAEMAQQEAEARKAMIVDNWHQLDRHLGVVELRCAEARAGFNRIIMEGASGPLHLAPVPVVGTMGPPSASGGGKRRGTTTGATANAGGQFPGISLPPIPGQVAAPRIVRARTPSMDGANVYPPSKRPRGNSDEMVRAGVRGSYSESHIDYPSHIRTHHQRMIHPPDSSAAPNPKYQRSRSRSSSNSSLDEMIIQASTPYTSNNNGNNAANTNNARPAGASGHVTQYQTHVFAPVVTGAPQKKSKYTSAPPPPPPQQPATGAPVSEHPQVPYPPTNEQGQRICRQCGLPGRYKEGKCVEKWGPGPMGPGTVCDRCRKKMKRVERRGTLESQQLQQQQLQAAHTLGIPIAQQQQSQRSLPHHQGIHRTDTLLNASSASIGGMSFRREEEMHSSVRMINSPVKRPPPSPGPSIAALREDDDDRVHERDQLPTSDVGRGAAAAAAAGSRSSSRNRPAAASGRGTPRPTNGHHVPPKHAPAPMDVDETDADADGDAEAEDAEAEVVEEDGEGEAVDEDAEAELLEAVNAAEANSSSSGRKSEGA